MSSLFSRKTFQYFELAKKHTKKKDWFNKNKELYEVSVKEPYSILIHEMSERFSAKLPGIAIKSQKLSRPLRPSNKAVVMGYVKASSMFYFSEKQTSIFEWNPGLYMQLGDEKPDNVIGLGLYGPSSRQIKRLRIALVQDYKTVDKILANRKLKKYWGGLAEEMYKRFPKDYTVVDPAAKYLWYKQFFMRRHFTRKEVVSKDFAEIVLDSYEAGLPLLAWIRENIGVYNRRDMEREKEDREWRDYLASSTGIYLK
jgi:uncharacterized protein (TIGR02453 family)